MPSLPLAVAVSPPIPSTDPLLVEFLRAALECYLRGDYRRAGDAFEDAAAVAGARIEAKVWASVGWTLHALVGAGMLVSVDASEPGPAERVL